MKKPETPEERMIRSIMVNFSISGLSSTTIEEKNIIFMDILKTFTTPEELEDIKKRENIVE